MNFDHEVSRCLACNGFLLTSKVAHYMLQKWWIKLIYLLFFLISEHEHLSIYLSIYHMLILKDQRHFWVLAPIMCLVEASWLNIAKAVRQSLKKMIFKTWQGFWHLCISNSKTGRLCVLGETLYKALSSSLFSMKRMDENENRKQKCRFHIYEEDIKKGITRGKRVD